MSKLPRPSSEQERLDLKADWRAQLKLAGGGERFSLITRGEKAVMSKYGAPDDPLFPPIDVVLDLCRDTGSTALLDTLARQLGFRLVAADAADDHDISMTDIATVVTEGAEFVAALSRAAEDGKITPAELGQVDREAEGAVAAVRRVQAMARAKVAKGRR